MNLLKSTSFLYLVVHFVFCQHVPAGLRAVVDDDVHVRPQFELSLPVGNGGKGCDDKEWTPDAVVEHAVQKGKRLDGFTLKTY